ncbi:glycosyltransferase family 2 protein [Steroidobacter sp.]|uniref:glycosyltransferase family 2 protein n=1 Tax=Steroidobacter sp. TaxID=1978227 RepID=UPI001A49352D|nr:glycosyltransferase family 2 protein [Steroidobacter sp.]MBL8264829.1 glycosyltransferase family 2 protein [Steroidobacter sp.]
MTVFDTAPPPPQASVSVIVPSYNCGRFLAEALDSLFGQTLQPQQIIVVDDGSSDDTAAVVGKYSSSRIQYIRKENGGAASARNVGLEAAKCEFIAFLDADDRWQPSYVEKMHGYLEEDPTVVGTFGNFVRFDDATGQQSSDQFQSYPEIKRPVLLRDLPTAHGRIPKERAFSALVACADIPAYLQVMMFRRSAIENLRFDQKLGLGADVNFVLKTFLLGGVVFTDEVLAEVRQHDASASRRYGDVALHKLNGLKALAPHVTRDGDLLAYRERLVRAHIDAAIQQTQQGRVGAGLRTFRDSFAIPGAAGRKLQGSARLAMALPQGLTRSAP